MDKLRIGIIGTGGIAHKHMDSYKKMDDIEIIGAADIVPGKARAFLDEFGLTDVPAFETKEELLALKPDGVSVCTYNSTHAECAMRRDGGGLRRAVRKAHVRDAGAGRRNGASAQEQTGKILTIGFQPALRSRTCSMIKHLVRSGELGHIILHPDRRRPPPRHTRPHLPAEGYRPAWAAWPTSAATDWTWRSTPSAIASPSPCPPMPPITSAKNPKYYEPVKGGWILG